MGSGSGDCQIVRLSDCQIVRLSDCQIVRLTDCQIVRLSDGEQVTCQMADACDMLLLITDIDILVIDIELSRIILIVDGPKEKGE